MSLVHLDTEVILSISQQWLELNQKWGEPVDLETEDSDHNPNPGVVRTPTLNRTTFDSSKLISKIKSQQVTPEYQEFAEGIQAKIICPDSANLKRQSSQEFFKMPSACSTIKRSTSSLVKLDEELVSCDEFSKIVCRVSRELSYLERKGKPRIKRQVSRGDVRHVRWSKASSSVQV